MSNIVKILVFLIVAMLIVALASLNAERRVTINYLPSAALAEVPVFLVILGSMFVGVLIAGLVGSLDQIKQRSRQRELQARLRALQAEVRQLRNLPIDQGLDERTGEAADDVAGAGE